MNINELANIASIVSAASTIGILLVTFFANITIRSISEYANKQNDRKIVEDVFSLQTEAEREFMRTASFKDIDLMVKLTRARELARLYELGHINLHLKKIINTYGHGFVIHSRLWDTDGKPLASSNPQDIAKYNQLKRDVICYFDDLAPYQNYLRIKG